MGQRVYWSRCNVRFGSKADIRVAQSSALYSDTASWQWPDAVKNEMSAWANSGQSLLFDHLIGARQQGCWHG